MICFNCGLHLHTKEEKECQICGVKFALTCLSCQSPNPAMARYCLHCGVRLSRADNESSVQNYYTLSETRRNVGVIFADVSGFTALSEKMDPEEVREIINDCFTYITKPVYELEGTIDKYMGDCVMILFGAKYTHSDDAKRAVMCAAKMMSLVRDFSEERLSSKGLTLTLSIGINYGLVVTGSVGNSFDKDYTVMGDIVNTAQRLQSNADRGTILVSESVYVETKDAVQYGDVKEIKVKNKENPVRCYSPIGLKVEYAYGSDAVFVGRDKEIGILNSIYNQSVNTRVRCVTVIGEGGIGKTRLVKEFVSILGSDMKKVWFECSSTTQNKVYHVISGVLMNIMNINSGDTMPVKQRRLASFLDYVLSGVSDEDKEKNYNFLGLVLGLGRDNEFKNILNSMSFDSIKREILKQLTRFFIFLSQRHKYVIMIDDIHWSDKNSLEIIKDLITGVSEANITFIFASRFELEEIKAVEGMDHCRLQLEALDQDGTRNLVIKLLKCTDISSELLDTVMKYTKGNPLYIGEFVSNIKKSGKLVTVNNTASIDAKEVVSVPNNLQGLILSNFSELDEVTMLFLQAAAVAGKEFTLSLVQKIMDVDIDEARVLEMPLKLNIISHKTAYTVSGVLEKVFVFNQDMEREVIYGSILNKVRKHLHQKIGELMEIKYSRDIEDYYEILFSHFHQSGLIKKSADYAYKTALKHKNNYNFTTSLEFFNEFLASSGSDSETEFMSRVFHAYKDIGYMHFVMANFHLALEYLNKALEAASMVDDLYSVKIMIAEVYKEQDMFEEALGILDEIQPRIKNDNSIYGKLLQMKCSILRIIGNAKALSIAKSSEKVLLKTKDYESLAETMNQAGIIYITKGDIGNSLFYFNKSYSYAEKINSLAVMAKISGNLGNVYHSTGMISKALDSYNKCIAISRKISDQQGYAAGCINLGILYMDKGLLDKAEILLKEALNISREISSRLNELICLTNLGDVMYERGSKEEALELYNKSLEISREINVPMGEGINYINSARLFIELEQFDKVPEMLEFAYGVFHDAGEIVYISDYYRYKGLYEYMLGHPETALSLCDQAISISDENKSDLRKLKALRVKGNIYTDLDEFDKAINVYSESITLAYQIESEYEAAKGHFGRFMTHCRMENMEEAKADLEQAKQCMTKVDDCRLKDIIMRQELQGNV